MQIVLARLDEGFTVTATNARIDMGVRPKITRVDVPVSLMWLRNGAETDIEKAKRYADQNGYSVFCYDKDERTPLERARAEIMGTK